MIRAASIALLASLIPSAAFAGGFGQHADKAEIRLGGGLYDTGPLTRHTYDGPSFNA